MPTRNIILFYHLLTLSSILLAQRPEIRYPLDNSTQYTGFTLSSTGKYLITTSEKAVRLWDISSGKMLYSRAFVESIIPKGFESYERVISPDGRICLFIHDVYYIHEEFTRITYWDFGTQKEGLIGHKQFNKLIGFSPNSRMVYYKSSNESEDDDLMAFDITTNEPYHYGVEKINMEKTVLIRPNGDTIDFRVKIYPLDNYKLLLASENELNLLSRSSGLIQVCFYDQRIINNVFPIRNNSGVLIELYDTLNTVYSYRIFDTDSGLLSDLSGAFTQALGLVQSDNGRCFYGLCGQKLFKLDIKGCSGFYLVKDSVTMQNPKALFSCFRITSNDRLLYFNFPEKDTLDVWDILEGKLINKMYLPPDYTFDTINIPLISSEGLFLKAGQPKIWNSLTGYVEHELWNKQALTIQSLTFMDETHIALKSSFQSTSGTDNAAELVEYFQFELTDQQLRRIPPVTIKKNKYTEISSDQDDSVVFDWPEIRKVISADNNWEAWWAKDNGDFIDNSPSPLLIDRRNNKNYKVLYDGSWNTSAIFSPNNDYVIFSQEEVMVLIDLNNPSQPLKLSGHLTKVRHVSISSNSKYVISVAEDGYEVKLWDLKKGLELATMIFMDSTDWVVTTPSGLFDASPGAMRLMHFVVGLEVIELEQLKERYYEPGLLSKVMGFSNEPLREVEGFDSVALYPEVRLQLDTLQNKLHIHLTPRSGGVGKVSIFVNEKEIIEEANPPKGFDKIRDTFLTTDLELYARYFLTDTLNTISIRAYNEAGWLKSAPQSLEFWSVPVRAKGDSQKTGVVSLRNNRRPFLYIVAVGTADYAGEQLDLKYSGKDAGDMAGALRQIGTQLFSRDSVFVQLLTTDSSDATLQPTKANIRAAFESIKKRAKAEDVLIVYFSGHGIAYGDADRALFYYLTREIGSFDLSDVGVRTKRAISSDTLTRWINDIPAQKQVLILDACNSGKVVENLAGGQKSLNASQIRALDRMKDRTGMFVLTGSAADKVSYEAGQFGQGLLTYSILEGMKGEVPDVFGKVDVMKLFQYACDRVPHLAKGIGGVQTPMLVGPLGGSFDIGIADSTVDIRIAAVKPVFIRNNFLDEERFDDGLGLTNALKDYLIDQTALGDATFIYVDVSEYEAAYSIKGLYRVDGDAVTIRGRLFKGKTAVGQEFKLTGKKNDLPGLVEGIVDEVLGMMGGE